MLTNDDKALILLCSHIGLNNSELKPLTLTKWNKLAEKIVDSNIKRPENLFNKNKDELQQELKISNEESENITKLLSRSIEISIELERLYSKGIKVITRASSAYPIKLRKVLKDLAPPVIFYCGNLALANEDGIGIVGSRNLKEEYIEFTKKLVKKAVDENLIIFSGGAKGIDDTSEKEAYINGGKYVSFISDSLEAKIKKKDIRDKLATNRVLLMTATKPDIGFSVGAAMNRNKYIYSLSNGTFVIASDFNKGGTWTGATENLKNKWTKTFVREDLKLKGNQELIKLGAYPVNDIENIEIIKIILNEVSKSNDVDVNSNQLGLEYMMSIIDNTDKSYIDTIVDIGYEQNVDPIESAKEEIKYDLYTHVINIILEVLKEEKTSEELNVILNINKAQLNIWLKRALDENKIKKLQKPVRYIAIKNI